MHEIGPQLPTNAPVFVIPGSFIAESWADGPSAGVTTTWFAHQCGVWGGSELSVSGTSTVRLVFVGTCGRSSREVRLNAVVSFTKSNPKSAVEQLVQVRLRHGLRWKPPSKKCIGASLALTAVFDDFATFLRVSTISVLTTPSEILAASPCCSTHVICASCLGGHF